MNRRKLSPYEMTQLARHGHGNEPVPVDMPIEYVTGIAEFCGLEFSVNPSVLIPRIETEGLVELALQALAEKMTDTSIEELNIIDVGTGSGAIIISVAKHLENVDKGIFLFATDSSQAALKVATANSEILLTSPITFIPTDLLQGLERHFDLITANLPYIPSSEINNLDKSVKDFEPLSALDGGDTGFEIIRTFLLQVENYLRPHATIILEVDPSHTEAFFEEFLPQFTIQYFNDCFDRHRFVRLDLKN